MSLLVTIDQKLPVDHQLERRVALALLTVKSPNFRFLHVQSHEHRVMRLSSPGSRLVEVDAHNGTVTLSGWVSSRAERETLKSLVRRVPGVLELIDDVIVTPRPERQARPTFASTAIFYQLSTPCLAHAG